MINIEDLLQMINSKCVTHEESDAVSESLLKFGVRYKDIELIDELSEAAGITPDTKNKYCIYSSKFGTVVDLILLPDETRIIKENEKFVLRRFDICDSVLYKGNSYRVDYFRKKTYWEPPQKSEDIGMQIINEIIEESVLKEWYERQEQGLPANKRFRYEYCSKEEATHLDLGGSTYMLAPINECKFIRVIDWSPEHIKERKEQVARMVHADKNLKISRNWYWE